MFGFLVAPCSTCLGRGARDEYRAHFCGLGNRLRDRYGLWARSLTHRDAAFLALLGTAQQGEAPTPRASTCCNPLARKRAHHEEGVAPEYAAAVSVCGLAVKLDDDAGDEGWLRRRASRALGGMLTRSTAIATEILEDLGFPTARVREGILVQGEMERELASQRSFDPEAVTRPTASTFGHIVGHTALLPGARERDGAHRVLTSAGYHLGALAYWMDAWKDYARDLARGRFNPLRYVSGNGDPSEEARRDALLPVFRDHALAFGDSVGALEYERHGSLLRWISRSGVRSRTMELFSVSAEESGLAASEPASPPSGAADDQESEEPGRRRRSSATKESGWWCCADLSCCSCDTCDLATHGCSMCDCCDCCDCCSS